jgi:cell wall-associated NlpC family hydrolase/exonuclease VII small subunit
MSSAFHRHRRKIAATVVASMVLVLTPSMQVSYVSATNVDDARRRVERIVDELERLAERSDKLAEDYAEAMDEKARLDEEIIQAEARLSALAEQLERLRGDLSAVAVRAFTGAGVDVLGPLFTSASVYSDSLQRDQYSRVALSVGTTTVDDYDALLGEYEREKRSLERMQARTVALGDRLSDSLNQTNRLRDDYLERRRQAERELGAAIEAEERRRAEESYRRILAEQEARRNAAASNASNGSSNGSAGGTTGSSGGSSVRYVEPVRYPQPSSLSQVAVNAAMAQQGVPYRYATSLPGVSFDCSGLTHYAWAQAGVYLPRNSRAQFAATPRVPVAEAKPGDLIYFYRPISHVGLYIGNGQMVHAPNTGSVVHVRNVNWGKVVGVTRPG